MTVFLEYLTRYCPYHVTVFRSTFDWIIYERRVQVGALSFELQPGLGGGGGGGLDV